MPHTAINPATGETIASHPELSSAELRRVITDSYRVVREWRETSFALRAEVLRSAARLLRQRSDGLAKLMAREMGKPVVQGCAEAEKCAWVCEFYAANAEAMLVPEMVETEAARSYVAYRPLGLVFAVMPWNYPLWQVFRFAAPALMGGNGGLLKHAENVPGCALAIETLLRDAGLPEGVFRTLIIDRKQKAQVIRNRRIAAVTLTGSTRAGKAVARQAGAQLKKCVLELGGSDPYLILKDAGLEQAVKACATSRLLNSGQSCIAAKRFIVVKAVRAEFERLLTERMLRVRMGDPLLEDTEVGPQARSDLRENLHRQVTESIEKGARLLLGGVMPNGPGWFYPPTVLTDVKRGMPAASEELFGPVAAIIPVRDEAAAITMANNSSYGLGAAVFTGDRDNGERIAADELEAGSCFVNGLVKSDPRLPFGGIKESGFGRELGRHGLLEFQNAKTVVVS